MLGPTAISVFSTNIAAKQTAVTISASMDNQLPSTVWATQKARKQSGFPCSRGTAPMCPEVLNYIP